MPRSVAHRAVPLTRPPTPHTPPFSQMFQKLQQLGKAPEFNNYLAFVLTQGEGTQDEIRQTAGLLLKNNLKTGWHSTDAAHQAYIQRALLPGLGNPNRFLRHTVGTALSMITRAVGPRGWPGLYTALAQILEQPPDAKHVDGALDCVKKACEELNGRLDEQVAGLPEGSAAGLLISRLLPLMANPDVGVRRTALASINLMVPTWPATHAAAMDTYLQGLFQLANDGDNGVRKHVCSGIVSLLYRAPEKLVPNIRDVITYMIEMTNFGDEDVALESCEFWAAFCEADLDRDTVEVLREFTPKLIPMLLTNMAYAEDDEEVLNAEDDEANAGRADRDQDIKPSFRGQKDKGSGLGEGAGGEQGGDDDEYYDDDDELLDALLGGDANYIAEMKLPLELHLAQDIDGNWRWLEDDLGRVLRRKPEGDFIFRLMSFEDLMNEGLNVNCLREEVDPNELIDFSKCRSFEDARRAMKEATDALRNMEADGWVVEKSFSATATSWGASSSGDSTDSVFDIKEEGSGRHLCMTKELRPLRTMSHVDGLHPEEDEKSKREVIRREEAAGAMAKDAFDSFDDNE